MPPVQSRGQGEGSRRWPALGQALPGTMSILPRVTGTVCESTVMSG